MRKLMLFTLVFSLLFCLLGVALAAPSVPVPNVRDSVYIYDDGFFISANMESELNERLRRLDWNNEIQFFIVTIESPGEMSLGEYAYRLFVEMGIGDDAVTGGILIVASESQNEPILVAGKKVKTVLYSELRQQVIDDRYMVINGESNTTMAIEATVNEVLHILSANAWQLRTFVTRQVALQVGIYALIAVGIAILGLFIYGIYAKDFGLLIISLHFLFELCKLIISVILLFNFFRGISFSGLKSDLSSAKEKVETIRRGGGGFSRGGGASRGR